MLTKAIIRSLLLILLLLLIFWIPRLYFHASIDQSMRLNELLSYNYLKTSILFDLKSLAIWFSPYFLLLFINAAVSTKPWNKALAVLRFVLILSAFVFSFIAVLYYPTSKTIVGKDLFYMLDGQESGIIWTYVKDYSLAAFLAILLSLLLIYFMPKIRFGLKGATKWLYLLTVLGLWMLSARGSLSLKPLNHLDAYAALPADLAVSAMSPIFVLLESLNQDPIEELNYFDEARLKEFQSQDQQSYGAYLDQKPNFCFLLLESFGLDYSGQHNFDSLSYMPFLDSLAGHSLYFEQAYANGLRSMDAVAAIYTGVPALMKQAFVGSLYSHVEMESLMEWLKKKGYYSSFFHGADVQSMGFGAYLKSQGLDHYEGKQNYSYKGHEDGHWGIYDHHYFQYFSEQLGKQNQPWFSSLFSLSSHHPYPIPKSYQYLEEGELDIHRSIRYTDQSLKEFFEQVKKQPWFQNTIFIITADHSSINQHAAFKTMNGKYRVPLMLYAPKYFEPSRSTRPVQHLDIFPSVVHCLGGELFSLGSSLLDSSGRSIVHYDGNLYSIVKDSLQLSWSGEEVLGFYHQTNDPLHRFWLKGDYTARQDELLRELKLHRQNFNSRMLNNTYR